MYTKNVFIERAIFRYFLFIAILFLHVTIALSQSKRAAMWYVGNKCLNFNTKPITVTELSKQFSGKGGLVYCDKEGNILLISSDSTIYNKNYKPLFHKKGTYSRNKFFIPKTNNDTLVYFFAANKYNLIDVKNENLVEEDIIFHQYQAKGSTQRVDIYAVRHSNCTDTWIIIPDSSYIYSYLLTNKGVSKQYHRTTTSISNSYTTHNYRFSNTGKYFLSFQSRHTNNGDTILVSLGKFDRTNAMFKTIFSRKFPNYYSVNSAAFSPDDSKFYISFYTASNPSFELFQVSIINNLPDFDNAILIYKEPPALPIHIYTPMQLGIDNKIYKTFFFNHKRIDIIHQPNAQAKACGFQANAIPLSTRTNLLPKYVVPYLSPSPCDLSFYSYNYCFGENTIFHINNTYNIKSVVWHFGDGNTSTKLQTKHYYTNEGEYTVKLNIKYKDGTNKTETQTINISSFKELKIHRKTNED